MKKPRKKKQVPYVERVAYFKAWHVKHRARRLRELHARKLRNRAVFLALMADLKSKPCIDCNNCFPTPAMSFDHVRGTKLYDVAQMRDQHINAVRREIAKCELVCLNCHAIRTDKRRKSARRSLGAPRGARTLNLSGLQPECSAD